MPRLKRYKGIRQLSDGRFLARYRDLDRRYHEHSLDWHEARDLEGAKAALIRLKERIAAGERPWEAEAPPESPYTFNQAADAWLEYSRIHLKAYRNDVYCLRTLRGFFGRMTISEITAEHVETFKQIKVDAGCSRQSVNHWISMLRRVLNKAKAHGRLQATPFPGVRLLRLEQKGRVKFFSPEEEAVLIQHAPDWLRPLITFSLHTGLRLGELASLRRQNANLERGYVYLEQTKSGKPRSVPLNETARAVLAEVLKVHVLGDDRVFRYSRSYISHTFTEMVRAVTAKVEAEKARGARFYRLGNGPDAPRVDVEAVDLKGAV